MKMGSESATLPSGFAVVGHFISDRAGDAGSALGISGLSNDRDGSLSVGDFVAGVCDSWRALHRCSQNSRPSNLFTIVELVYASKIVNP